MDDEISVISVTSEENVYLPPKQQEYNTDCDGDDSDGDLPQGYVNPLLLEKMESVKLLLKVSFLKNEQDMREAMWFKGVS